MSRILVIGTGNTHKVQEIAPLLMESGLPLDLREASRYGRFEPVEDGGTLEENALIKARAAQELSGEWALADDTGLEVDVLGGRPGIYAARYAGPGCTFADNIHKLLGEMQGVPPERRTARFACVIALCVPGQEPRFFRGECPGSIASSPRGSGGFGYDPVFTIAGLEKSFAELTTSEKNGISHRALAVKQLRRALETELRHSLSPPGRVPR